MTVSAVTTASFSLNELIREAFDVIGVGSEGEAVSADMYRRAKSSAMLMTLSFNAMDDLWRRTLRTVTPVSGQAAYSLTPKPMRVLSARRKQLTGGYETPMTEWSRQEYLDMPNKTSSPSTPAVTAMPSRCVCVQRIRRAASCRRPAACWPGTCRAAPACAPITA